MDAGDLDQKIQIQKRIVTEGALGEEQESWVTDSDPWAKVIETPGREFLKGDFKAEEKAVFIVRWRTIDSTARVLWCGRAWRIDSVTGTFREGYRWLHTVSIDGAN